MIMMFKFVRLTPQFWDDKTQGIVAKFFFALGIGDTKTYDTSNIPLILHLILKTILIFIKCNFKYVKDIYTFS